MVQQTGAFRLEQVALDEGGDQIRIGMLGSGGPKPGKHDFRQIMH
jgi:hypothetical protein